MMRLRGGMTPLDVVVISVCGVFYAVTLSAATLIWCRRSYPPFFCRNVPLMAVTAVSAFVWWLSLLGNNMSFDLFLPVGAGNIECGILSLWGFAGLGITIGAIVVRIRVFHAIYVLRKRRLWPQSVQILVLTLPFLLGSVLAFGGFVGSHYSPDTRECVNRKYGMLVASGYILLLTLALTRMLLQLSRVRQRVEVYRDLRLALVYAYIHLPIFALVVIYLRPIAPILSRNIILLYNIILVTMTFWTVAYRPLRAYLTNDTAYRDRYTQGYDKLLTPAMLREQLEHQLTVPALREQFLAFASKRQAQENVAFYAAVLERDETEDYFARIAMSMDIIDTFIRPGAPQEINLSHQVRDEILQGQPIRGDLFEKARVVVLGLMETNLKDDFEASHEYHVLQTVAAHAEAERTLMHRINMQRPPDPVEMEEHLSESSGSSSGQAPLSVARLRIPKLSSRARIVPRNPSGHLRPILP